MPLLDVVGQVEVRVVELVLAAADAARRAARATTASRPAPRSAARPTTAAIVRGHAVHSRQKFISRLMWKMLPLAPTGIGYAV